MDVSALQLKRPLVIFDLETTGTDLSKDRIVEIAMIKVNPDGTVEKKPEQRGHKRVQPWSAGRHGSINVGCSCSEPPMFTCPERPS